MNVPPAARICFAELPLSLKGSKKPVAKGRPFETAGVDSPPVTPETKIAATAMSAATVSTIRPTVGHGNRRRRRSDLIAKSPACGRAGLCWNRRRSRSATERKHGERVTEAVCGDGRFDRGEVRTTVELQARMLCLAVQRLELGTIEDAIVGVRLREPP